MMVMSPVASLSSAVAGDNATDATNGTNQRQQKHQQQHQGQLEGKMHNEQEEDGNIPSATSSSTMAVKSSKTRSSRSNTTSGSSGRKISSSSGSHKIKTAASISHKRKEKNISRSPTITSTTIRPMTAAGSTLRRCFSSTAILHVRSDHDGLNSKGSANWDHRERDVMPLNTSDRIAQSERMFTSRDRSKEDVLNVSDRKQSSRPSRQNNRIISLRRSQSHSALTNLASNNRQPSHTGLARGPDDVKMPWLGPMAQSETAFTSSDRKQLVPEEQPNSKNVRRVHHRRTASSTSAVTRASTNRSRSRSTSISRSVKDNATTTKGASAGLLNGQAGTTHDENTEMEPKRRSSSARPRLLKDGSGRKSLNKPSGSERKIKAESKRPLLDSSSRKRHSKRSVSDTIIGKGNNKIDQGMENAATATKTIDSIILDGSAHRSRRGGSSSLGSSSKRDYLADSSAKNTTASVGSETSGGPASATSRTTTDSASQVQVQRKMKDISTKRNQLLTGGSERLRHMKDVSGRKQLTKDTSERNNGMMDASSQNRCANKVSRHKSPRRQSGSSTALKSDARARSSSIELKRRPKDSNKLDSQVQKMGAESPPVAEDPSYLAHQAADGLEDTGGITQPEQVISMDVPAESGNGEKTSKIKIEEHKVAEEGNQNSTGKSDDMGFPMLAEDKDPSIDFGHLPDFQVTDFSFKDLHFAFDSESGFNGDSGNEGPSSRDEEKQPGAPVENVSKGAVNAAESNLSQATKQDSPPRFKANSGAWVCENCGEQHEELELQFCGMCGTEKSKTTPGVTKAVRKASSRREGHNIRRQGSHVSSDGTGTTRSDGGKKSPKLSSVTGARGVRSRERLTTTPKSRKEKMIRSVDRSPEVVDTLVAKCLDGGEVQVVDIDLLNERFTTFASSEPPTTPSKPKKQPMKRSQSDVAKLASGRTLTGISPQPPKPVKMKGTARPSQSVADSGTQFSLPLKAAGRQPIPRRAKSSSTEYLQQLQHKNTAIFDVGNDSIGQSAHSPGQPPRAAGRHRSLLPQSAHSNSSAASSGRPSLAGGRPSMMKAASQRLVGGLIKSQKSVENALALAGMSLARSKGDALLLDSDDEEFANDNSCDTPTKMIGGEVGMLRDFNSEDMGLPKKRDLHGGESGLAKSPRRPGSPRSLMQPGLGGDHAGKSPRRLQSARNVTDHAGKSPRRLQSARNVTDLVGDDAMKTPRRLRPSLGIQSNPGEIVATAEGGLRTPRRRRAAFEMRSKSLDESGKGPQAVKARAMKKKGPNEAGVLDYGTVDIDLDEEENIGAFAEDEFGYALTPRRARERVIHRPLPKRESGAALHAKSDHGTRDVKCPMTARSRIRRMSLTTIDRSGMQTVPDLQQEPNPPSLPATPKGGLSARSRIVRASLAHIQIHGLTTATPPPSSEVERKTDTRGKEDADSTLASAQDRALRAASRPGRARRRGSVGSTDPMLIQALAHMPQDLTHAVREDLKEEWKRQEQIEDMRKKAQKLQKRYLGGVEAPSGPAVASAEPVFEAMFFDRPSNGDTIDDEEGSGAELELADDEHNLSDLSSFDE
jgi:hypothetical protein